MLCKHFEKLCFDDEMAQEHEPLSHYKLIRDMCIFFYSMASKKQTKSICKKRTLGLGRLLRCGKIE